MKSIRVFLAVALVLLVALPVWAGSLPTATPEKVGLSSERLERIGALMQEHVDAGQTAGELGMIAKDGKVAYFDTRGFQDREAGTPMEKDTIFRIYSMSKPITSVGLMMLFEEGRFLLQEPVSKYIPELGGLRVAASEEEIKAVETNGSDMSIELGRAQTTDEDGIQTVPAQRDMTIQDLLRHTAGLTYGFFGNTKVDQAYRKASILSNPNLEDMIEKLGEIPLLFQPGTQWHYSVAVDVQGRLIEVLSGQRFDDFLEERIFEPLGMDDTGFYVPEAKAKRLAQVYRPDGKGGLNPIPWSDSSNYLNPPTFFSGGGGLVSTAEDYMRFCLMHLNGGELDGVRILGRKTVELMRTNHLGDVTMGRGATGFGLGFSVALDQGRIGAQGSVGTYSWGGAAGTSFWIDPVENMVGVYMVQIMGGGIPGQSYFKNLAYQALID